MGHGFRYRLVAVGVEVTGEDDLDPVAPAREVVRYLAGTGKPHVLRVSVVLDEQVVVFLGRERGRNVQCPLFPGVLKD